MTENQTVSAAEVEQWEADDEQVESVPGTYRVRYEVSAELWVDVDATNVDEAIEKSDKVLRTVDLSYAGSRHTLSVDPSEPYAVVKPDGEEEKVQPPYWVERNAAVAELNLIREQLRELADQWPVEQGRLAVQVAVTQILKAGTDEHRRVTQGHW